MVDVVIVSVVVCVTVAVVVIAAVPFSLSLVVDVVSRCPASVFLLLFPLFSLRDDRCWDFLLRSENEEGLKGICFN